MEKPIAWSAALALAAGAGTMVPAAATEPYCGIT